MESADTSVLNACFKLIRHLPPKNIPKCISAISCLINDEDTQMDFQQKVDQPIGK